MSPIKNTSLLVSVKSPEEFEKMKDLVDIIDLKNPNEGALGAWNKKDIIKVVNKHNLIISATLGNIHEVKDIREKLNYFDDIGLNYIKVGLFDDSIDKAIEILNLFKEKPFKTKLVPVLFAENRKIIDFTFDNLNKFIESKIEILLLDTLNKKSLNILNLLSYSFIRNIIYKCDQINLKVGLAGKININDLNNLLLLRPYLIGLRSAVCKSFKRESSVSIKLAKEIKSHFIYDNKNAHDAAGA